MEGTLHFLVLSTAEIPFRYNGCYSYRIEIDLTNPEYVRQRRIWTLADGGVRIEDWTRIGGVSAEGLAGLGYRPVEGSVPVTPCRR
jgi:hypothetical protein